MKLNSKNALKSSVWYTVSTFLVRGLGIITTPIFTRLLSQEDFGGYSNFSSWLSIAMIIVTLNLGSTLVSACYDYRDKLDSYIASMLMLNVVSVTFWAIIVNAFQDYFSDLLSLDIRYINLMLVYLLFYPAFDLFQVRERYCYRYKMNVFMSIMIAVSTALMSIILVNVMKNKMQGRIIGSILPTIIIGMVLYVYFFVRSKGVNFKTWLYALKICLPYISHLLSMTILESIDRVMITKICGAVDTALYSLAYKCGTLIMILAGSINLAYHPWLSEHIFDNDFESVRKVSRPYVAVPIFIGLGIMLISPEILCVLGGRSYLPAKYVMPSVTAGCMLQFMYTMFVNIEQIKKKTVGMAFGSVSAAILNYGLNLWLIPKYGYIAAAYTTLAGYGWLLFIHMLLVKRLGMDKVYDYKFILMMAGLTILMTVSVNFVYQNNLLRVAAIIVYLVLALLLLYKNWRVVMVLMKNIIK